MAITLQTTTGTQADVNAALGLPSDSTPATEPTTVTTATAESMPKPSDAPAPPVTTPGPAVDAGVDDLVERTESLDADTPAQKKHSRLTKRFSELTAEKYLLQGRIQAVEAENKRLWSQTAPAQSPAAVTPATVTTDDYADLVAKYEIDPGWPKDESFDTYERARAAQAVFIARREAGVVVDSRLAVEHQRTTAAQQVESGRQAVTAFAQRVDVFKVAHPDYAEVVVASNLPVNDAMKATIFNPANDGPAIAYYLGQHPEECERISKLSPGEAWEEMGVIKAGLKVSAPAAEPAPRLVPPVTKAPAPPQTVRGAVAPTSESLADLAKKVTPGSPQTSEWLKRRAAEVAARR